MTNTKLAKKDVTQKNRLLEVMQSMVEREFTEKVLIPLFESMRYSVEYYGGPYEGGKDLICWREDDFGDKELTLIQVKKTKPSAAASSTRSFGEIVTQLQQAKEKKVANADGIARHPSFVFFVTPYSLDTRALESRFEKVSELRLSGVKVFDGVKIAEQVIQRIPDLALQLCGSDFVVKSSLQSMLSNADLLSALNYSKEHDISDFYCDLDFGVGKITTKFFFALDFSPSRLSVQISEEKWNHFEQLARKAEELFKVECFGRSLNQVKEVHKEKYDSWKSTKNQNLAKQVRSLAEDLSQNIESLLNQCRDLVTLEGNSEAIQKIMSLTKVRGNRYESNPQFRTEKYEKLKPLISSLSAHLTESFHQANDLGLRITKILLDLELIQSVFLKVKTDQSHATIIESLQENLNQSKKQIKRLDSLLKKLEHEPTYSIEINGENLASAICKKKEWLRTEIESLRRDKSQHHVHDFFSQCNFLLETVDQILVEPHFSKSLGYSDRQQFVIDDKSARIRMPLKDVFETGINCAIFGDAGAGKSTTLRMYAETSSQLDGDQRITLFLPLSRVINASRAYEYGNEPPPLQKFETNLAEFLTANGHETNTHDLVSFLKKKDKVVFIFDGIDEVIKTSPWIVEAIEGVDSAYPNSQTILSSRASGEYVKRFTCLSLKLLPFSDEQLVSFVHGWFKGNSVAAQLVEDHLGRTPEVSEIARSPLLATILCTLAANDVPLPSTELNMYHERMKLLFGHYDIHKKTKRIDSHHSLLDSISKKLAFYLHSRNLRSASLIDLQTTAIEILGGRYSKEQLKVAVKELQDPCNVLVPMTEDGQFGFGHLRYQEYLAATELCANRGTEIGTKLASAWWRGVLVLFSRMTDDIENIISEVLEKFVHVGDRRETLQAMIAVRSSVEQKRLNKLLTPHFSLDKSRDELLEFYEYDSRDSEW